jgi:pentatricopeptide repeat domain-containing protein 1
MRRADGGAQQAVRLLEEHNAATGAVLQDHELAQALLETLIRDSSTDAALSAMQLVFPSRRTLQAAVGAFAAKGSARGVAAVRTLAESRRLMRGAPASELWFSLIAAYGKLGRLDDVRAAFKAARAAGAWAPVDTWHTNLYLHALHTDVALVFKRARQLLDSGAGVDASTFNILLKACMRARDPRRADLALEWMSAAGVAPDAVTYSSLIKAYSYAGQFDSVLRVRDDMAASGYAPPPPVWGSLLVACGAAQQLETALMLWREVRSAAAAAGHPVPTPVANAMMTACNACRTSERALEVLTELKAAGGRPDATTYNLAFKACQAQPGQRLRRDQIGTALVLYGEMVSAEGVEPNVFTYGTLIELCAEARQGRVAAQLLAEMEARGVRPNVVVMTALARALARSGQVEECVAAFGRMVWGPARLKPTRAAFRGLIRELRAAGALGAALRMYQGMRRAYHAPVPREFQDLIAAAAEAALAQGDPELQAQVSPASRKPRQLGGALRMARPSRGSAPAALVKQ